MGFNSGFKGLNISCVMWKICLCNSVDARVSIYCNQFETDNSDSTTYPAYKTKIRSSYCEDITCDCLFGWTRAPFKSWRRAYKIQFFYSVTAKQEFLTLESLFIVPLFKFLQNISLQSASLACDISEFPSSIFFFLHR